MTFHPKRILIATDFSESARPAVDAAADLARTYGAHLHLLHVVPLSNYVDFAAGMDGSAVLGADYMASVRAGVRRSGEAELARLRGLGVPAEFSALEGSPALVIAGAARELGADLVVVGTHGRTGLKHVLLGSVAEGVVRHCAAPVLTVRSANP